MRFKTKLSITHGSKGETLYTGTATAQDVWNTVVDVYTNNGMTDYLPVLKEMLQDAGHSLNWKGW